MTGDEKKETAGRIRAVRQDVGLNQLEFSIRVGLKSQAHLSKIERAEIDPPLGLLRRISKIFNVSIDYLLTGSKATPEEPRREGEAISPGNEILKTKDDTILLQKELLASKDKELLAQEKNNQLQRKLFEEKLSKAYLEKTLLEQERFLGGLPGKPLLANQREKKVSENHSDQPREKEQVRLALLGSEVPDFMAETTKGRFTFYEFLNDSWAVLFSHPKDYTPVCTTEFGRLSAMNGEFDKLGVKIISLSVNSLEDHFAWIDDINETQGCKVNFPVIADPDRKIAELYNMIHPGVSDTMTVRSAFIIGPDRKIKLILVYPLSTGKNFEEILRVIKSLQLAYEYEVGTPAGWQPGDECVILPSVKEEDIDKKFPNGYREVKPYLRYVPQPAMTG